MQQGFKRRRNETIFPSNLRLQEAKNDVSVEQMFL